MLVFSFCMRMKNILYDIVIKDIIFFVASDFYYFFYQRQLNIIFE